MRKDRAPETHSSRKPGPTPRPPRTGFGPRRGDEAEPEGRGGSTVESENEVWPDIHPINFVHVGPGVCVTPDSLNSKKLAPGATAPVVRTGPKQTVRPLRLKMAGRGETFAVIDRKRLAWEYSWIERGETAHRC